MNPWLAVLKQVFLGNRVLPYLIAVWVAAATVMTAALWPECPYPFESMAGMAWRLPSIFLVMLGIGVWALLLRGVDAQLSPAAVQLVPGLRRIATIVTIVAWLLVATGVALEMCVYGVPFPLMVAALLLLMAITVARRPALRSCGLLLPLVLFPPIYGYRFPLPAELDAAPSVLWIAALVAIAFGASFIVTQIGKRAEAHASSHRVIRPAPRTERAQWAWDAVLKRPKIFQWLFGRMLRARSPEVRMLHGLGTAFHWSHAVVGAILQAVPVCLLMYGISWVAAYYEGARPSHIDPVLTNASLMAFFFAIQLADFRMRELYARRKEQALLVILPGAPTGRDVNRWLVQTLLFQHVFTIIFAFWFVVGLAFVLQEPLESTLNTMAPPLAASLLTTPALVRDYASMRQLRPFHYTLVAGVAIIPLYVAIIFRRGIDPIVEILLALLLSGIIAAWRYARFADAAPAFPVGREAA